MGSKCSFLPFTLTSTSNLTQLEASGANIKSLLERASKLLGKAAGITLIDEPGYYNGLLSVPSSSPHCLI